MVVLVQAEIALAGHVLDGGRLHIVVGRYAGDAAAEQRHVAGQAQCQVDVGAAAGDTPGAVDARCVVAADFGMRDVGGTAADVDDYRLVPLAAFGVVMHGRSGGFFKEIDLVEAGLGRHAAGGQAGRWRSGGCVQGCARRCR
ncbi:hypothetical protein G6F35_017444 [Rhizopus arrhizus]|nr:hypothetical protein G6F35_017444 [Rhizopus arrhizus]